MLTDAYFALAITVSGLAIWSGVEALRDLQAVKLSARRIRRAAWSTVILSIALANAAAGHALIALDVYTWRNLGIFAWLALGVGVMTWWRLRG